MFRQSPVPRWTTYTSVLHPPAERANYIGSYTSEYRVIIAGTLKGANN